MARQKDIEMKRETKLSRLLGVSSESFLSALIKIAPPRPWADPAASGDGIRRPGPVRPTSWIPRSFLGGSFETSPRRRPRPQVVAGGRPRKNRRVEIHIWSAGGDGTAMAATGLGYWHLGWTCVRRVLFVYFHSGPTSTSDRQVVAT